MEIHYAFHKTAWKKFWKTTIILLPLYLCLGPLLFWVGLENIKNNAILDHYASETTGKITGKHRYIRYDFTPKIAYNYIGSRGFLDTDLIWEADPTGNPSRRSSSQYVSSLKYFSFKRGDTVIVEYALHKGKLMSRIHNPLIPFIPILMLIIGVLFLIADVPLAL